MMPKFIATSPKEGDVITKESIKDNVDRIEAIDFDIDAENFREEGLDRQAFFPQSISRRGCRPVSARGLLGSDTLLPRRSQWRLAEFRPDQVSSGDAIPRLNIPWDPEFDTHCVVRVSLEATNRVDLTGREKRADDFWDFGLLIVPPGVELGSVGNIDSFMAGGGVWPYQRVKLSPAFTRHSNQGFLTYNETYEETVFGTIDAGSEETDNSRNAVAVLRSDANSSDFTVNLEDTTKQNFNSSYPRGEWFQYGYERGANWSQSFTLIALCTSLMRRSSSDAALGFEFPSNTSRWTQPGTAQVFLAYRCRHTSAPLTDEGEGKACITALRMMATKHRR